MRKMTEPVIGRGTYFKDDELAAVCEHRRSEETYLIHRFKFISPLFLFG